MYRRDYPRERTLKKTARLGNSREIINKYKTEFPLKIIARVLSISRQRIYQILREPIKKDRRKMMKDKTKELIPLVEELSSQFSYYGYRKITAILNYRYGIRVNRKTVYAIMKEKKLLMPVSHSHKRLFKGVPFAHKTKANKSNALWGIDMTYIWCGEDGWGYFHGVIDHYDKTLLGYNFSLSCKAIGGVMALSEAFSKREARSLELRSDNGCHYGAKIFRDEIRRLGIDHTRTMVNTPKGNSVIERFFRSLKEECVWQHKFSNFEETKIAVAQWVNEYNKMRPHQSLGYIPPEEFYRKNYYEKAA